MTKAKESGKAIQLKIEDNFEKEVFVDNVLLKDGKKYSGQYVATRSFKDKKVVSHNVDIDKVFSDAKEKGVDAPVVFYVPNKKMVHIY